MKYSIKGQVEATPFLYIPKWSSIFFL